MVRRSLTESTHFAVVYEEEGSEHQTVVGIVTMEDVIEEILQEEIFDETDIISKVFLQNCVQNIPYYICFT